MNYNYSATVLEVIDGDTVKLSVRLHETDLPDGDLGFHIYVESGWVCAHENLRLLGINAPEKTTDTGKLSKLWLSMTIPVGTVIDVQTERDKTEKYGRFLATITRTGDVSSLNDQLVEKGYAFAWDGHGPRPTA